MLTPIIAIFERLSRRKPTPPQPPVPALIPAPALPTPAVSCCASPPAAAAPAPFPDDLAQVWREVQLANAREARPLNFSQLVARIKRDAQHPLYAVGIQTLRRHMMVIDPKHLKAIPDTVAATSTSRT